MITLCSPERYRPVMQAMVGLLAEHQVDARLRIVDRLADVPDLDATTILVSLLVPCGAKEMDAMPRLRAIVSPLLGYDWIDVEEASRRAIPVVNGEVAENRESMAEATLMLLLMLLYRLKDTEAQLRGTGVGATADRRMLKGRSVGIIGSGGIAREILSRLENWGVDLQVFTRHPSPDLRGARQVTLDALLRSSDVVILMTRLEPDTRHLLDRERLARMKPGALLINTARGGLVDESALVDLLRSGHLGGAALDVFETEPLPKAHPLRTIPGLILTPHSVGHTVQTREAVPKVTVRNVLELSAGALPESLRNPSVREWWKT
jgi:D-3-phosphoglycerate dehydrogenase